MPTFERTTSFASSRLTTAEPKKEAVVPAAAAAGTAAAAATTTPSRKREYKKASASGNSLRVFSQEEASKLHKKLEQLKKVNSSLQAVLKAYSG